jgi:hypothetical protein
MFIILILFEGEDSSSFFPHILRNTDHQGASWEMFDAGFENPNTF